MNNIDLSYHDDFSFTITKAAYDKGSGEMRWSATASDTGLDLYGERMSLDLFKSFIRRIESGEKPPQEFCTSGWCGGLPYPSVSHYQDLDGKGIPGTVKKVYIDGNRLKASGTFNDDELGRACFRSICDDLYGEKSQEIKNKVRISIGFLDYAHRHGEVMFRRNSSGDVCPLCKTKNVGNEKVYMDGQLVHLALTRIPANTRTDIIPLEVKSMSTRKSDAATIVGEELAQKLEEESVLVGKSTVELVEKSDEQPIEPEPEVETVVEKSEMTGKPGPQSFGELDEAEDDEEEMSKALDMWAAFDYIMGNIMVDQACSGKDKKAKMKAAVDELKSRLEAKSLVEKSATDTVSHILDTGISALKSAFDAVVASNMSVDEKLRSVQEPFNVFGNVIKSQIEATAPMEVKAEIDPVSAEIMALRSEINAVRDSIALLNESIKGITAQTVVNRSVTTASVATPVRRSIAPETMMQAAVKQDQSAGSLHSIIRRSVGLS